jgi:hypothetical protein
MKPFVLALDLQAKEAAVENVNDPRRTGVWAAGGV